MRVVATPTSTTCRSWAEVGPARPRLRLVLLSARGVDQGPDNPLRQAEQVVGALFGLIRDGHDAHLSDGVQRALGRPATGFEDWAAREVHGG